MKSPLTPILTLLPLLTQAQLPTHPHDRPDQPPDPLCGNTTCPPRHGAAHIIVTRGSTEPIGNSILDPLAEAIAAACPGTTIAANPYPALLDPYVASETAGLAELASMVLGYASCCLPQRPGGPRGRRPGSGGGGGGRGRGRLVLLGYSQGAQITADFLCGASEVGFPVACGYAADVADDVAAIVLVGDPSFVKDLPWDRGDASKGSYFPRLDTTSCNPVADKMISYCDAGDLFCDNGTSSDALLIHEIYAQKYGAQIVDYVVGKIGGCGAPDDHGAGGCNI